MNSAPVKRRKRIGTRPFVAKGVKFYLSEWAIVAELLALTDLNITELVKAALRDYAAKKGLDWPLES